jgi:hypothetical protein
VLIVRVRSGAVRPAERPEPAGMFGTFLFLTYYLPETLGYNAPWLVEKRLGRSHG